MLSKFWSNALGKEKINEVLDDTIKSLTNLSDMLKRTVIQTVEINDNFLYPHY